jgi:hypothetical protein
MMLMPGNNTGGLVHYFAGKYPGKIGLLMSPDGWRVPPFYLPYGLDNGCFKRWDEVGFFGMLRRASLLRVQPLWVCVPDAVADAETTFQRWHEYSDKIASLGFRLSFVAQDGMERTDVPQNAFCVFVGGSTDWKLKNAHKFKGAAKWLHIGRVNTLGRLKWAEGIGADSVDGTGWLRAKGKQYNDFVEYFTGSMQMEMFN